MDDDAQATALISAAASLSAPAAAADGDDALTPVPPPQKAPRRPLTAATTSNTSSRRLADNSASLSYMSGASITSSSRFLTMTTMTTMTAPPSTLSSFASSHNSQMSGATSTDDESGAEYTDGEGKRRPKWWKRMVTMRSVKRPRRNEQQILIDQELYVRSILESYSSSLSSNRMSSSARYTDSALAGISGGDLSPHPGTGGGAVGGIRDRGVSTEELTSEEAMYLAQLETPNQFELDEEELQQIQNQRTIGVGDDEDDHEARNRRRIQRRITKEALRAKQLEKSQHLARTRKKLFLFILCIGITLSGFIVAAVMIARVGIDARTAAANSSSGKSNSSDGSNSTVTAPIPTPTPTPMTATPTPVTTLAKDNPLYEALNGTLPPRTARSGISLIGSSSQDSSASGSTDEGETGEDDAETSSVSRRLYTYVHCVLMSLSLWMSLVVIGMHITFRSFRTYSLPLVLELSFVQCGYWITSLLRVQFVNESVDDIAYLFFCMAESFFNFGQISFTCAIAFNMYRSVVSYADVLLDSHSAKQRYRTYTVNVMLLSLLGSVTLSLVGYRKYDSDIALDNFQPCLYPTCRLILYVYYPLLAFGFNFIFYIRFKRTIGESYPISATGRLNKVARSYLVLFFICWGSLITLTSIQSPDPDRHADEDMQLLFFILQSIFDVLGVGTAVITLTNFHRCRKAFDFGLSLKTIDPHNIEFEDPVNILGEGTFALVLKAKWHQGVMENSISRTVDVAVKTFKHTQFECLDQMKEEAYLSSKLMHPCVMMTYGCYTSGSNLYIVYEFLGGGTLQDVLDANTSLPYETVLRYAHMIAMGMRFLHGLPVPIIHRDLKPLNCIFDSDQEMLKVADFGESRLFQKNEVVKHQRPDFYPSADLTLQMTTNIGSACWAAPEVLKDEATSEYSVKVDVYSFGIMCWQLYTCKIPYVDIPGSVLALSEAVLDGHRPEIPEDCPTLFAKIMRRCWHESAPRRPNFEDIVQLLEMELADERRRQSLANYTQPLVNGGYLRRKADFTSMMSSMSSLPPQSTHHNQTEDLLVPLRMNDGAVTKVVVLTTSEAKPSALSYDELPTASLLERYTTPSPTSQRALQQATQALVEQLPRCLVFIMRLFGRNGLLVSLLSSLAIITRLPSSCVRASVIQVALNRLPHSPEATLLLSNLRAGTEENTNELDANGTHNNATSPHLEAAETRIFSGEGSHTIQVQVGGQTRELIIDTGSGKTAFICEGCHDCGDSHSNAPFRFTSKTKYLTCENSPSSTESELASMFSFGLKKSTMNTCKKCVDNKCEYSQTYVEGDYWVAYKVSDEMQFAQNEPEFKSKVEFGCIYKQDGVFNLQTSDGIMGFSKHPDSIFEQFYRNKVTKSRIFSQCLGTQGGMLTFGGVDLSSNYDLKVMYTPIRDTGYQYWTVTLLSIQVGSVPMDVDSQVYNKERGCVFDSGTTFLYLPSAVEESFKDAWRKAVGNTEFPISSSYYTLSESEVARFPSICFLFLNDAKLCMKPELYFYRMSPGRYAGTISFGDGAKSTIIGASALTNYNVIYDIDNSRIGIAKANCEASVHSTSGVAMVELSLNPGGDTFRSIASPLGDSNVAIQWILVAATFFGVVGLVNALWMELKSVKAEKALEAEMKKSLETKMKENGKQQEPGQTRGEPKTIESPSVSFDEEDNVSAFSFILMHDDDDDQHGVGNQEFGHK